MRKSFSKTTQSDNNSLRFLLTNGMGGFITHNINNNNIRSEDSILTISKKAPVKRTKLIHKLEEKVIIDNKEYKLYTQNYVSAARNELKNDYLISFEQAIVPKWIFKIESVIIEKTICFEYLTNNVYVNYQIINPFNKHIDFQITPLIAGHELGHYKQTNEYNFEMANSNQKTIFKDQDNQIVIDHDGSFVALSAPQIINDYYYEHDSRDGRGAIGSAINYGHIEYGIDKPTNVTLLLSDSEVEKVEFSKVLAATTNRVNELIDNSKAFDDLSRTLVMATDQFIVNRENTNGKTIIAGYPFFTDWGRDTFWALNGCCLQTRRYDEAKQILQTFIQNLDHGLLPNLFVESGEEPFYNSIDAPLLFINSVYEYYLATNDIEFIEKEAMPAMMSIVEYYQNGTKYSIKMDDDYLIYGGEADVQLTWMDVRFGDIMPTHRHGKPVEINAFWYNGLCILDFFSKKLAMNDEQYGQLAQKVKTSFNQKFIAKNGKYLKDVVSGNYYDEQIRSNQIWAVSCNFSPIDLELAKNVVQTVFEKLYTPLGLRTLDPADAEFKPIYGNSHFERDMAYHQGTVWTFPMGGFITAYLKVNDYDQQAIAVVKKLLAGIENTLAEGNINQIAEVFDGLTPTISKGCYAQAWSSAEILRAYIDMHERN